MQIILSQRTHPGPSLLKSIAVSLLLIMTACNYDVIPDDMPEPPPTATTLNASFSVPSGQLWQNCPISFTADSFNVDNTYSWNFGDNQTSSELNPEHTYNNPGTYTVRLTVSNGTNDTSHTETIIVYQTRKFEDTRSLGTGYDSYREVLTTVDGGYIVFGTTSNIGAGGNDIYLAKTSDNGTMIWEKTYGGASSDYGADIIEVDNGYVLLGNFDETVLINVDQNGTVIWQNSFPSNGLDAFWENAVIQTSDGGYAIVGQLLEGNNWTYSMGMIKTDANGNLQWMQDFIPNTTGYGYATSVVETSDGGFIIVGEIDSKTALVKSDASGSLQWNKTIGSGGTSGSALAKIIPAIDGGFIVCGTESDNNGDKTAFIAKTDVSGNSIWDRTFGNDFSVFYDIDIVDDEGYIFTGLNTSSGSNKAYMVEVNKNSVPQWEKQYNTVDGFTQGVARTPDCGFVSVGSAGSEFLMIKTDSNGNSN